MGEIFRDLALHKESEIHEGHLLGDHVHMMISIPPKYSVSQVVGYIKGKSTIQIALRYMGHERNYTGQHFWVRGYYVPTVGRDEKVVRKYIQRQQEFDQKLDQLNIF